MSLYSLSQAARALARRFGEAARTPAYEADPIDHPAIAAMSLIELADLPLAPSRPAAAPRADRSSATQKPPYSAAA